MTRTTTRLRGRGATNEPVELARYTISSGERVIFGQRVLGVVRLVDAPAAGSGRRYVIERELTSMAELEAIVADYLQQAAAWNTIPAVGSVLPAGRARGAGSMTGSRDRDSDARESLTEQEIAVAELVGRYVERRERGEAPCADDLSPWPPSSAPTRSSSCGPCWRSTRRCARASPAPADAPTRHPRVARPGGRAGGRGSARQRGGPQRRREPAMARSIETVAARPTPSATRAAKPTASASSTPRARC